MKEYKYFEQLKELFNLLELPCHKNLSLQSDTYLPSSGFSRPTTIECFNSKNIISGYENVRSFIIFLLEIESKL